MKSTRGRLAYSLGLALGTALCLGLTACDLEPPVSVAQRESLVDQGTVFLVTNTSDEHLHDLTVTVESPDGEEKSLFVATLEPHETLSVGWLKLDGWPIPAGSSLTVSCDGYLFDSGPWK